MTHPGSNNNGAETSVRVSVRIRPILGKEKLEGCMECVRPTSWTELVMEGKEKRFTFDNVFGKDSSQGEIYDTNVSPLVKSLFDGYNATVLAYGQTGSGKTYTMGTSTDCLVDEDEEHLGMIPRAMGEIFEIIEEKKESNPGAEFYLRVQFLEVYGEDIRDLLDPAGANEGKSVAIREGSKGEGVVIDGAREEAVKSTQEMLNALERGALCRTTGSTQMNFHSSRSHAIFTIIIEQHLPIAGSDPTEKPATPEPSSNADDTDSNQQTPATPEQNSESVPPADNIEYRIAKFHFVDLAGSERAKRTGATGTRLKEGININKGLLALGNVISALGDETKQATHVPYRDSKLTRMLQDSLGGNSRTLMIACVSPADANIEETLNALRYANRARNIKNKPVVNRDPNSSQIAFLKAQIAQLRAQLLQGGSGTAIDSFQFASSSPALGGANSSYNPADNGFREELEIANSRAKEAENEIQRLQEVIEREKRQRSDLQEKYVMAVAQVDFYTQREIENGGIPTDPESVKLSVDSNAKYLRRIEDLEHQLEENDAELNRARKQLNELRTELYVDDCLDEVEREIIRSARSRKSVGMRIGAGDDDMPTSFSDNLDELLAADEERVAAPYTPSHIDIDQSLLDIHDDDDEVTRELKERYQRTQEEFKTMVHSYDVTLRSKEVMKQKIVEERKRYEAMKAHYESKMAAMNAEVRETQKQRDDLDDKIKDLEGKKSTDQNKAQISKLRAELKQKNERLKSLEEQAKQLGEAKRMAKKWETKEQTIVKEIESLKRSKVEFQKKMEESAKRYREEAHQRTLEIARLKKEKRVLSQDKQKLQQRTTRDEKLLKQKTEQVTSMQRKLRQAQRLTSHNQKLSDKEKQQRAKLETWAKERIKQAEEMERLQRSLLKKEAAIARKEKLCRELEECKKSAELRAKIAEANAAQALLRSGSTPEKFAEEPPVAPSQPQTLEALFFAGQNEQREADNEALRELQERLEAAEFEISFQDKKVQEAAANISDDETGEDDEEVDEKTSNIPGATNHSRRLLPFEIKNMGDAVKALQHAMEMYIEMSKVKEQLVEKIDRLEAEREAESKSRREFHRRKSLMPLQAHNSPGSFRTTPHPLQRTSTSPAMSPIAGSNSAVASPMNSTVATLRDRLSASESAVHKLHEQNQAMVALLKEHNINFHELAISQMEDYLQSLKVVTHEGSRRSSLSNGYSISSAVPTTPITPPDEEEVLSTRVVETVFSPAPLPLQRNRTGSSHSLTSTGSLGQSDSLIRDTSSPTRRRPVFDRLCDTKNFTGVAKQKLIDLKAPRRHPLQQREVTVDEISLDTEQEVDELSFPNDPQQASLRRHATSSSPRSSPRLSIGGSTPEVTPLALENTESPRASRRHSGGGGSGSPSFSKPTESYIRAQEDKRATKRDSTGSASSLSAANVPSKPAFCSAAAPGRNNSRPYPALTESSLLKNETGTYKAEGNGLYRASSNPTSLNARQTTGTGRARQATWESQKQQRSGTPTSDQVPKLVEVYDNNNFQLSITGKSDACTPRVVDSGEKENTESDDGLGVSIHEKLSDPKNYTGTQKHKSQMDGGSTATTKEAATAAANAIKARMAQERLRRKNSKRT